METVATPTAHDDEAIQFDLGTFEGFNFRSQSAILQNLTVSEVVAWDHDRQGEAEFWPAGDRPEVAIVFNHRTSISGAELLELDRLLQELGDDSTVNFLRIHYAVNICGEDLSGLSREDIEDQNLDVFLGSSFIDLRREAAFQFFELYYPDEYRVWEKSICDGLIFDTDRFLDSPSFFVEEVTLGDEKALLVAPQ
jgi:hypothetical protein